MHSGIQALKRLLKSGSNRVPTNQESGASSAAILIAVVFLAILLFAAVNLVQFVMFNIHHFRLEDRLREPLEKEAMKVLELLYKDKTPQAESPLDIVWEYIDKNNKAATKTDDSDTSDQTEQATTEEELAASPTSDPTALDGDDAQGQADAAEKEEKAIVPGTYIIKLEDISSRLNPNWLDSEFITRLVGTPDIKLFKDPKEEIISNSQIYTQDFNTFRDKTGLTLHPEETYKDWIWKEAFEKGYFTGYSYFNINITNVFVFRQIYKERIGEIGAEALEQKIKDLFTNSIRVEIMEGGTSTNIYGGQKRPLDFILGGDVDKLTPVINAQPVMNIHLMSKKFIKTLLKAYEMDPLKIDNFFLQIFNKDSDKVVTECSPKEIRDGLYTFVLKPKIDEVNRNALRSNAGYFLFRVLDLFGSYTWFWRLTITGAAFKDPLTGNTLEPKLTWIIARIPQPGAYTQDPKKLKFKILEKEYTVNKL